MVDNKTDYTTASSIFDYQYRLIDSEGEFSMRKLTIHFLLLPFCILLAATLIYPTVALSDPYPSNVHATPVNATSILVTWSANAWAQSYRVYRNMDLATEVAQDADSFLDTGLQTGMAYYYRVASVVDGTEYSSTGSTATWAMPLNAPVILAASSRTDVDTVGQVLFLIDLSYTAVDGATGYEIFAREEGSGAYAQISETMDTEVTVGYLLPAEATRFWFKVRACNSYLFTETNEYQLFSGPFSNEVSIEFTPLVLPNLHGIFLYEKVWPWDFPWAAEYLSSLLDVYGDTQTWPLDIPLDTAMLSELARKLSHQETLTAMEQQIADAIHPHGLALLIGVYESPPGEQAAMALSQDLSQIQTLLGGAQPEALSGEVKLAYYDMLQKTCALASLSMDMEWDGNHSLSGLQINTAQTSDIVYSSMPGTAALLQYLTELTPSPVPTATPAALQINIVPAQLMVPISTPTPTPLVLTIRITRP